MNGNLGEVLQNSPLFGGIPVPEIEAMLACLQPKMQTFLKNTYITMEGEAFTGLGIILAGEALVTKENAAGRRIVMTSLQAGGMFGEMVAFSGKPFWPASVFAQTECSVLFLPPAKITEGCGNACECHTRLIRNLLSIISERALLLNRKVEYLAIKSMRGKISAYLLEQHKLTGKKVFVLPLSRHELADFLNVSRTALSREMGRMRDEGVIEFFRSSVKVKDIETLKREWD
ncbi:Hypothetical protein LUCI_0379 [Lucifera butyrica]|uniref:Crp bacterial regulatory protein hth signature n=1 Tax=Lucifera butyrica TaxID=1351585 RepID=A0A498R4G9_9FIRM|nr:Crp/Fnr family transcriptional regulator [Lucifera butyrica]VBB05172.1 Hypothetical protein LUCI_0379 [Lucifera butyrica]